MLKRLNNNKGFVFTAAAAAIGTAAVSLGASAAVAGAIGTGVVAAGALGLGAYAVNRLTQQPKSPAVQSAKGSEPSYDRASALAQGEADDKRRAIARNKTQYTTPQGLTPTNQSNLNLKTLTGV